MGYRVQLAQSCSGTIFTFNSESVWPTSSRAKHDRGTSILNMEMLGSREPLQLPVDHLDGKSMRLYARLSRS